jgi:hypothetical protein
MTDGCQLFPGEESWELGISMITVNMAQLSSKLMYAARTIGHFECLEHCIDELIDYCRLGMQDLRSIHAKVSAARSDFITVFVALQTLSVEGCCSSGSQRSCLSIRNRIPFFIM